MAYVARAQEPSRRRRLSVESVFLLELVVLMPAAGALVLWLIPKWFDIHWSCVTGLGEHGLLVGGALLWAAAIGHAPCPS